MSLTRRERLTRRNADIGYRHHGKTLTYYSQNGVIYSGWVGLVRVIEELEVISPSDRRQDDKNETALKGYNLRLRSYLFPEGFTPSRGDKIALDYPFDGKHRFFHIDNNPRAFNMSGLQVVLGLTPTSDPAALAPAADGPNLHPPIGHI